MCARGLDEKACETLQRAGEHSLRFVILPGTLRILINTTLLKTQHYLSIYFLFSLNLVLLLHTTCAPYFMQVECVFRDYCVPLTPFVDCLTPFGISWLSGAAPPFTILTCLHTSPNNTCLVALYCPTVALILTRALSEFCKSPESHCIQKAKVWILPRRSRAELRLDESSMYRFIINANTSSLYAVRSTPQSLLPFFLLSARSRPLSHCTQEQGECDPQLCRQPCHCRDKV
jgi:hypothetical protein